MYNVREPQEQIEEKRFTHIMSEWSLQTVVGLLAGLFATATAIEHMACDDSSSFKGFEAFAAVAGGLCLGEGLVRIVNHGITRMYPPLPDSDWFQNPDNKNNLLRLGKFAGNAAAFGPADNQVTMSVELNEPSSFGSALKTNEG